MFANDEALARISHELRTPLNAILGFGQLLALDQLNESQRHSVEQILSGGRHLLALIEDLLDLSRVSANNLELSLEPVDLGDEIAQAVALCRPLAAENALSFRVEDLEGDGRVALADRRRLRQVLLNLISNAIKYNRPAGSITVRIATDDNDAIRLDVSDTGLGMTPAELQRLFAPFERLDADTLGIEGNGLGLAVSKALTEAMGGTLQVASTPGAGSMFTVRLAAAEHAAPPARATDRRLAAV
jgi:signal transduction histidine kinase